MKSFKFSTVIISALVTIIGKIPIGIRQYIGRMGGLIFSTLPLRERRIATQQLISFLKLTAPKVVIQKMYAHFGQVAMECLNLKPLLAGGIKYQDERYLSDLIAKNDRPVIALTSHSGNWELLAAYTRQRGAPLIAVGRPARNALANILLEDIRNRHGIPVMLRADRSGTRELIEALKSNHWIGALIDQDTQVASIPVNFFERPAQTPVSIVTLGKRYNARFMYAFAVREASGYTVYSEELSSDKEPAEILEEYNRKLEGVIRLYPDQWVWFHKRWRTTVDGTRLTTQEYLQMLRACDIY